MNPKFEDLLSHILENIRFGSKIKQNQIDQWFKEFSLKTEDRWTIYDELDALQKEINKSSLRRWFYLNNMNEPNQVKITMALKRRGHMIIYNEPQETDRIGHNLLDGPIHYKKNKDYLAQLHSSDKLRRKKALSHIVKANSNLIWKIVRWHSRSATVTVDKDDMYQVGAIGLITAAKKYDSSQRNKFSSYAPYWIGNMISRELANHSTLIRFPVSYRAKMHKLLKIVNKLWSESARAPSSLEISEAMNEPIQTIKKLRSDILLSNLDSLDRPVEKNNSISLSEQVSNENAPIPDKEYDKIELKNVIDQLFKKHLTDQERHVLHYRFGLKNTEVKTFEETGKKLNLSRSRALQIEVKALKKLRTPKITKILEEYFYTY